MANRPKAPGEIGRIDAIGQGRTDSGQFTRKQPKLEPLEPQALAEIAARRERVVELALKWQPTREEWAVVCHEAHRLYELGFPPGAIAEALDLPTRTIRNAVAAHLADTTPDREKMRHWGAITLESIVDEAHDTGDFDTARKAVMDMMAVFEVVQKGTRINVVGQLTHVSEQELENDMKTWTAERFALEDGTHATTDDEAIAEPQEDGSGDSASGSPARDGEAGATQAEDRERPSGA